MTPPNEKIRGGRRELERKAREAARAISFVTPNPRHYMVEVDKLTGGVSVLPIRGGLRLDGTISIDRQGFGVKLSHGEGVTKISK